MMWQQPKTDWQASDDVSCNDYNRIKGNLIYLKELASILYPSFDIEEMGEDKTEEDYPYADEINLLEENLKKIAIKTWGEDYGEFPVFQDNGAFINFVELNHIESAVLDMHNQMQNQYYGRRKLMFMLGNEEEF